MSKVNLRQEARGRECTGNLLGICNRNPETTILAHLNNRRLFNAGLGMKVPDWAGCFSCSACHDVLDGRATHPHLSYEQVKIAHMEAVFRTQRILFDEGKLCLSTK
jgi:hypothetical protein